jgi:hypothetical protein
MRNLVIALLLFTLSSQNAFAENSEITAKKELVQSIVGKFQTRVVQKWGQPIKLKFVTDNVLQATSGFVKKNKPEIEIYDGALALPEFPLATIVCHELGHILGDVPHSLIEKVAGPDSDLRVSVEGEADYFSGKCMRELYSTTTTLEYLTDSFAYVLSEIDGHNVKPGENFLRDFNGINNDYPEPACRLVSFEKGLNLEPRPKCWFNPQPRQ